MSSNQTDIHSARERQPVAPSHNIAIRVSHLSKRYHIYNTPRDRLKQFFLPRLQALAAQSPRQYFREFWALKDLSFEIKKGQTVGIIGRNGSGKSTLLQLLCGIVTPTEGVVEINGRVAALLELGAGFNPEFTGRENVFLSASVYGLSRQQIARRFDLITAFADIGEFMEQPVKTYSSGMFVRLAFAVIAHVDADILVIDEALAVGDAYFVQKCMRFLREFAHRGTLLFVSHDTSAVVGLCSQAILMANGKIERIGLPKDVANYYLALLHKESQGPADLPSPDRPTEADRFALKVDLDSANFGTGAAKIISAVLEDLEGKPVLSVCGSEVVRLIVVCSAYAKITKPIVGFLVRDRLGQVTFGDNTYLTYANAHDTGLEAADELIACFEFAMPILQTGEYAIDIAIAGGTQLDHVQHHWVHSATTFHARPSVPCFGQIAVPMDKVSMTAHSRRQSS